MQEEGLGLGWYAEPMRRLPALLLFAAATLHAQLPQPQQQQPTRPFTLQQILSAPYALSLTAAPVGGRFAWVENAEGVRNLWVASATQPARQITHYTEDDGQDIGNLAWSPDATSLAYTYGAETGAGGRPANPDERHGQALHVIVQPLAPDAPAEDLGEGRSPLFMHGGCGVFFLRGGKVWARGFLPRPSPGPGATLYESLAGPQPAPPLLCQTREQGAFQVVTDRGSAHSLTLSPDGNLLAYISRRSGPSGGHSFLALYDLTALILQFSAPSTGNDSAPAFSPDGHQLAWLRAPATDAPEFATNRTSPNPWSIQLATLDAQHVATRTLFTPEANKPGSVLPRFATGDPRVWWAGDGKLLFCSESDGWNHLYALDLLTPHATPAKPVLLTPGAGEVEDVSVSPDGHHVLWSTNKVQEMFIADGAQECVAAESQLTKGDRDRRLVWSLDLSDATLKVQPLRGNDEIQTRPLQLEDGSIVALASGAFVPMHPVFMTGDPYEATDVMKNAWPRTYPESSLVFPKQVIFPSSSRDGQSSISLHGQLFLPGAVYEGRTRYATSCNGHHVSLPATRDAIEHPAILFFHGGPRRQMLLGYPAMDYYSNAYAFNQYLASRGYIVLSVNYRGGIGYGLDFRQCEHCGADGAAEYADVLGAQAYLASRPDVDPKRIGLWGGSYGGYLTALGLARNSDLFAAGVDFHGVHEWALESNASADWLDHDPTQTAAERDAILAHAHASSPMADIAKWRSPILLIHGDDDPEVAYAQTPVLTDALRARGVPVEVLIFPDEVHGFLLHRDWLAAYQTASDFFDRTLRRAHQESQNVGPLPKL